MTRRSRLVWTTVLVVAVGAGALYLWRSWPRPALPELSPSATPEQVTQRYFQDLERNRSGDARRLIAPDLNMPQPTLSLEPALGLSSDPGYWSGLTLDPADRIDDSAAALYAPYRDLTRVVVHLDQVYRDGQSNDYGAGDPVDLYFLLGRKTATSPWRIVDIQDNGV